MRFLSHVQDLKVEIRGFEKKTWISPWENLAQIFPVLGKGTEIGLKRKKKKNRLSPARSLFIRSHILLFNNEELSQGAKNIALSYYLEEDRPYYEKGKGLGFWSSSFLCLHSVPKKNESINIYGRRTKVSGDGLELREGHTHRGGGIAFIAARLYSKKVERRPAPITRGEG